MPMDATTATSQQTFIMLERLIQFLQGPIASASIRTTGVLGLRLLFQAGHLIVLARLLGPSQFGLLAAVMASAMLLGKLATFGTQYPLLRNAAQQGHTEASVLSYALPTTLTTGLILFSIFLPATYWLTLAEQNFGIWPLLAIAIAELLTAPLITLFAMAHLGHGRIASSQLIQALPLGLRFIAATVLLIMQPDLPLLLYAVLYVGTSVITLAAMLCTKAANPPNIKEWRLPRLAELKEAASFGLMDVATAAPSEIDKAIAPYLLTPHLSGLYAVAGRTVGALTLPVSAMMLSALPRLFRATKPGRDNLLLRYTILFSLAYSIVLAIALWWLAPFIGRLFGPAYTSLKEILHIFCFAVPAMALRVVANSTLMSLGQPIKRASCELLGITILIISAAILGPHFGVSGLALSYVISQWTIMGSGFWVISTKIRA